jgi:hypothetical protein
LLDFAKRQKWGVPIFAREFSNTIQGHPCIALVPDASNGNRDIWINILWMNQCYAFNVEQKRWAFDREPINNADELAWWASNIMV